jgi:tetratricopeptide (TPR) repeat protein
MASGGRQPAVAPVPAGQRNPVRIAWVILIPLVLACRRGGEEANNGGKAVSTPLAVVSSNEVLESPRYQWTMSNIQAAIGSGRPVAAEDIESLWYMLREFPPNRELADTLAQVLAANSDWNGLIELNTTLPPAWADRAALLAAYMKSMRFDDVIARVRADFPDGEMDSETRWALGSALYSSGRFDEAIVELEQCRGNGPLLQQQDALATLALCHLQMERLSEAKELLEQSMELGHEHLPTLANLARVHAYLGEMELAAKIDGLALKAREVQVQRENTHIRMLAMSHELREAWQALDFARTTGIINQMMPHADASMKLKLQEYLDEIERRSR